MPQIRFWSLPLRPILTASYEGIEGLRFPGYICGGTHGVRQGTGILFVSLQWLLSYETLLWYLIFLWLFQTKRNVMLFGRT